ncbi:MAG: DUF5678 domain-containing protein [Candidatus Omnitrophota bacterium]
MKKRKIPISFWEDRQWIFDHYQSLSQEYADTWIAVVNRNVVSHGGSIGIVKKETMRKTGKKCFPVEFIERGIHIYHVD